MSNINAKYIYMKQLFHFREVTICCENYSRQYKLKGLAVSIAVNNNDLLLLRSIMETAQEQWATVGFI